MSNMIRQGDVLLRRVPRSTVYHAKTQKPDPEEGLILAAGEATGHHHRVRHDRVRIRTQGNRRFLVVPNTAEGVELTHEEHAALPIPPGTYEIVGQREMKTPRGTRPPARRTPRRTSSFSDWGSSRVFD